MIKKYPTCRNKAFKNMNYIVKQERKRVITFYYPTNSVMIVIYKKRKENKNQHISKTSKAKCLI